MDSSKEYRPKYYDMCELRIGQFKVGVLFPIKFYVSKSSLVKNNYMPLQ